MPFHIPVQSSDIDAISNMSDAVVRNLWITQSYHDLGTRLSAQLGGDNGSWLSFGVWASNTAGANMRNEELPAFVRDIYDGAHELHQILDHANRSSWLRRLGLVHFLEEHTILGVFEDAVHQVGKNLGIGNGIVYAELAPVFAKTCEILESGARPDEEEANTFVDEQPFVGTPENIADAKEAFRNYFRAAREHDPERRAQLVYLANLQAVLHEQRRLQEPIEAALEAPITDGLADIRQIWLVQLLARVPGIGWVLRKLDAKFHELEPEIEKVFERAATLLMMTLETKDATLHLGEDLPPPKGAPMLPPALEKLTLPPLIEFLQQWDHTDPPTVGSAAKNWAKLDERMNYICSLFRSRQQIPDLRAQPFSEEQRTQLLAGQMPTGKL